MGAVKGKNMVHQQTGIIHNMTVGCGLMLMCTALVASPRASALDRIETGEDGTTHVWTETSSLTTATNPTNFVQGVGIDVAIIAAAASTIDAPFFTDPRDRLMASGQFASVTVINAGNSTPDLSELTTFDAVLVWSNLSFADADTLGDNLVDYVNGGGGVVVAVFANSSVTNGRSLGGRWQANVYDVIPTAGDTTTGPATLGSILLPGHALVAGVTSFDGGSSSFRPTTTSLVDSGILIAQWSDGSTLVAVREDTIGSRVDLGFYPPSDAVLPVNFWDQTTDGDQLMVNALLYAAQRTPLTLGDADSDGDVDLDDFIVFENCLNIDSQVEATAGCAIFDFDGDYNVDCFDWFTFRSIWTGPENELPYLVVCTDIIPTANEWGLVVISLLLLISGSLVISRPQARCGLRNR